MGKDNEKNLVGQPIFNQIIELLPKEKFDLLVHQKAFVKMLKINVRIERLLNEKDLIKRMDIFGINIYTIADIELFLRNNKSIHK